VKNKLLKVVKKKPQKVEKNKPLKMANKKNLNKMMEKKQKNNLVKILSLPEPLPKESKELSIL
jgi:hypothetical protein